MSRSWIFSLGISIVFAVLAQPAWAANLPFGQVQTGTIGSAAQTNSYTFSANANDVIDFTIDATSGTLNPKIQLYSSTGTLIGSADNYSSYYGSCQSGPVEFNTVTLQATGTYTVLVGDCGDTNTGNYTIYAQLTDNPTGAAALPFGGVPQIGMILSATQSNSYTFSGNAADVVDFTIATTKGSLNPKIRFYSPAGAQISVADNYSSYYGSCQGGPVELNTVTLPVTGTYTALLGDCGDTNTGNYSIYAQRTNNPTGAVPLIFGGQPQAGTISSVVQSNSYVFSGTAKDVIDFTIVTAAGNLDPKIRLYNPAGAQIGSADNYSSYYGSCQTGPVELNTVTLPVTGAYTLLVGDCGDTNAGNYNLSAQCFGVCASSSNLTAQTITFGPVANQPAGTAPFTLTATASSGLPVTFTSNSPSVCTVSGNIATLVGGGTCSITANQGGNATYAPAASVTQTFTVASGPLQITSISSVSNQQTQTITIAGSGFGTHSPYTGDSSYLDLGDLTGSWGAGYNGAATGYAADDAVGLVVTSWTDSQILLGGFSGDWGSNGWTLNNGDQVQLWVWNAQTGAGPVSITTTVGGTAPPVTCTFALAPGSQIISASGGTGTVGVLTSSGCSWTASSNSSFLSISSGAGGSGPGVVQFSAAANTSPAELTGTLTIAGQTAAVIQPGTAPLLQLTPASVSVQWRQGTQLPTAIPLTLYTTASSLSYTVLTSTTGNWLTVSATSGTAPGTLFVTVNPSSLQPGTYQGIVNINAPSANPASQFFTVSLTVLTQGVPVLDVSTQTLNFSVPQGTSQDVQTQRIPVLNSGGGTLTYTATASTVSGGNWLSVVPDGAGATPTAPDLLPVNVNPASLAVGTYTGQVTITAGTTTQNIPVTLTVTAVQQSILLSQTGLTFTAVVNGGIVPPQTFGILNSGSGVMPWTVTTSTVSGGSWLSVTPSSGSTDASSLTVPLVTVSVNPANLSAGQYSGQIQVVSTSANNSPQFLSVILNVLPAGSNPGPVVLPTGLIFTAATGGAAAAPQTFALSNLTATQVGFAANPQTYDGNSWLSVTPTTGTAGPTQATTLTVSVNGNGLSSAIRQGVITLLFQDGSVRTVSVVYLLANLAVTSGASGSHVRPAQTSAACKPTKLLPLITSLGSQFVVPAAWPNTLAAQVVDDCGNPHVNGTVVASFSSGDPPLPLVSLKNGQWTGSWQVNKASSAPIAVTVMADNPALDISGTVSVAGSLQSSSVAPVMTNGGILNAASYSPSAPLAPGSIISIFGSNLANGSASASTLPLPNQLSGTLVTIGGLPAPLLYAGSSQINAVIPYGLPVNTTTQVIVRQGNAYTTPQPITLATAEPAIFTVSAGGTGQGIIIRPDGNYAAAGTPANAGDEITIYAVGLGDTSPEATAGQAAPTSPLEKVLAPMILTIGGQSVHIDFAGMVPTLSGLYQINAAVPTGVSGNSLPVVLTVGGQPSPVVTMAVQ